MKTILTRKELHRKNLILKGIEGFYTNKQLAFDLMLSTRRVKAIKADYLKRGDKAFVHGNKGKRPATTITENIKNNIIHIYKTEQNGVPIFKNANFTHFAEILEDYYNLKVSKSSVSKILKKAGFKSPKRRRKKGEKTKHLLRIRKETFGCMVQADGTEYDWFGTGQKYAIQGFIDDATGIPVGLYMTKHECLFGYIEATRYMLQKYGIPEQLYPDRAGVFFMNQKNTTLEEQLTGKKPLTQFGRMMKELGVDMFPAYSPEAKGRIERFWQTIQSRLPIEFKINGIKTVEQANLFLPKFMKKYAKRFGVKPSVKEKSFVLIDDLSILTNLLTVKLERTTDNSGVVSIHNYKFMIPTCIKRHVLICMSIKNGIYAQSADGKNHPMKLLETDSNNPHMPQVWQNLINEYFLKDTKAKYRGSYQELG